MVLQCAELQRAIEFVAVWYTVLQSRCNVLQCTSEIAKANSRKSERERD